MVRSQLLLLVALTTAIAAIRLGESRALDPHEIYVAETASEMLATRDFLLPRFNGNPRIEKPPLSYWLAIATHEVAGDRSQPWVTELEARLPSLLAAAALVAVTYAIGAASFEPQVGLLASAFLVTSWDFFTYARSARPEMLYTLLCSLVLLGFVLAASRAEQGRSSTGAAALAWSALAAALLAKGPQIPAFFVAGAAWALSGSRARHSLRATLHPWLGVAAVALIVPYFLYVARHTEHALALWSAEVVQDKPLPLLLRPLQLYYPIAVFAGLVPWVAVAGYTAAHCWRRRHPRASILITCIVVTLVVLSFAGKLRRHYVLPLLPPCTVLMAWALVELRTRGVLTGDAAERVDVRTDAARARSVMQRLLAVQAALVVLGIAVAGWIPFADACTTLVSWPRMLTFLIAAATLVWLAYIEDHVHVRRAWTTLIAAVLVIWCGVAASGIDGSRRWRSDRRFARELRVILPKNRTLLYDSGTLEPLVYYGGLRLGVRRFEQWSDAWGTVAAQGERPLFICEERCSAHGLPATGRVLLAGPKCGTHRSMVLFQPSRVRRRAVLRHTCER